MGKKIFLTILFTVVLLLPGQDIKEYVQVNWRIIPLYAVDKDENPILDLGQRDIALSVAGKEVKQFVLYGKNLAVAKTADVVEEQPATLPPRKLLFFVFDTALTDHQNIEQAKKIARDLLAASDDNSFYLLLTVDPVRGLMFHGKTTNKSEALELLEERIKRTNMSGAYNMYETMLEEIPFASSMGMWGGQKISFEKFDWNEIRWMLWLRSVKYRHKCQLFYDSFKYLYYSIRTLAQSKVVFLFSQGISTTFQQLEDHEEDKYRFQLKEIANFLNLSGAALFVINPAMADNEDGGSGRESLRYLAVTSGGKYLAGTKATIVKKVNNMNRAYYELAFAEDETLKDDAPPVAVKAKRRGVRLYSVNHIARRKNLADMNTMEREMVVVSLLNKNPFVTMEMKVFRLTVSKAAEGDSQGTCTILVPVQLLNQPMELYKVSCDRQGNIKKMESMPLTPSATAIKIEIPQDEKQMNSAVRLVLLDIAGNRAWVQ